MEPPLLIPNRIVKHTSADDTEVERPWDNMSLPELFKFRYAMRPAKGGSKVIAGIIKKSSEKEDFLYVTV